MLVYVIPASSSPWSDTLATTNKVYYAGNTTNGANYTWYTTTAGTQGSSYSICPRNWRLPSNTEYTTLLTRAGIGNNAAGSTKIRGTPYNFPYAGFVNSGALQNVGSGGGYWSSTANGTGNAYYLDFYSSGVATSIVGRYNGFSVRCIAP